MMEKRIGIWQVVQQLMTNHMRLGLLLAGVALEQEEVYRRLLMTMLTLR